MLDAVDPSKDVDGFHPMNVGPARVGPAAALVPCTPRGCMRLLARDGRELAGARAVVVGREQHRRQARWRSSCSPRTRR